MSRDFIKKGAAILILLVSALFSGGCSTVMTRPFPNLNDNLKIGVTDKHAPEDDWAPGVYPLAHNNICFARGQGQEDVVKAGALFGLIGTAISMGESAGRLKKLVNGEENIFTLDLQSITQECLKKELKSSKDTGRFSTDSDWKTAPLQITPYTVFSFVGEDQARLWVVLRLEWIDQKIKRKKWNCRYLVGLGGLRPLTGESGWSSNNGKLLESTVNKDTHLALRVMLDDLQGKLRSGMEPKESIWANWMFYKDPIFAKAQKLKSNEDWDVILPLVEDEEYFAGINIVPKDFSLLLPMPESHGGVWGH